MIIGTGIAGISAAESIRKATLVLADINSKRGSLELSLGEAKYAIEGRIATAAGMNRGIDPEKVFDLYLYVNSSQESEIDFDFVGRSTETFLEGGYLAGREWDLNHEGYTGLRASQAAGAQLGRAASGLPESERIASS